MTGDNSAQFNPSFSYVVKSFDALYEGRYRDGVTILRDGLDQQVMSAESIDVKELVKHISSALSYLEYRLEDESPKTMMASNSEIERRCSFCSRKQSEVARLMAGPDVFICDNCIQAFSGILESTSD